MANAQQPSPETIIVIGAGVLGLTTATLLQSKFPHKQIAIVAAEFHDDASPSADYASAWAGAHYRPIPASTPQLKAEAQLGFRTFEVMKRIAKEEPGAGVKLLKGVEYFENPPESHLALKDGDVYAGENDGFRLLEGEELPEGVKLGFEYQAYCVNVPVYCSYLLSKFGERNGIVIRRRLTGPADAMRLAEVEEMGTVLTVVNCSGRNFDTDPAVSIIRGQTCLVKNQYDKTVTRQNSDGSWAILIPRPLNGGTIVGVSKELGDLEVKPRASTREKMFRDTLKAFPDFLKPGEKFEIIKDNVGRRPAREGGIRLEVESMGDGRRRIVHGYGAGGRGYELSWGVAEKLVELVTMPLSDKSDIGQEEAPIRAK